MPDFLKDYFTFNQAERKGIIILLALIVLLLAANLFLPYFVSREHTDFTEFQKAIAEFEKNNTVQKSNNTTPFKEMERKREEPSFEKKPYNYTPFIDKKKYDTPKKVSKNDFVINLNTSDTAELKKIYGIGTSYANRIIKYRNLLGGYARVEQLQEIYNFDTLLFQKIKHHFYVEEKDIHKININTADFKTLIKHPYLNQELTHEILNYRFYQKFDSIEQLKEIYLVNDSMFVNLAPYFKTSE